MKKLPKNKGAGESFGVGRTEEPVEDNDDKQSQKTESEDKLGDFGEIVTERGLAEDGID